MVTKLNSELAKVQSWMTANRLTINVAKTEMLLISNRNKPDVDNQIAINGDSVRCADSCKFLGVILDNNLTFNKHINHVVAKLSRSAGILYRIRKSLPHYARLNYYYSFVYPYLNYNIITWAATSHSHLYPLIIQHKRIIRLLTDSHFREHTTPLFSRLGLLKLLDIYKYNLLIYIQKLIWNGKFQPDHDVNTRSRNLAVPTFQRLTRTQQSVSYAGPSLWNDLPNYLKEIVSPSIFKRKLKVYLIGQYSTSS